MKLKIPTFKDEDYIPTIKKLIHDVQKKYDLEISVRHELILNYKGCSLHLKLLISSVSFT